MKRGMIYVNLLSFSCISIVITVVFYFLNVWLISNMHPYSSWNYYTPTDFMLLEGILLLIIGSLLLLGRGGINLWTLKAGILSALAGALYGEDTPGPSETLRRDSWKPSGFISFALVLILTGVLMIFTYFLTL